MAVVCWCVVTVGQEFTEIGWEVLLPAGVSSVTERVAIHRSDNFLQGGGKVLQVYPGAFVTPIVHANVTMIPLSGEYHC